MPARARTRELCLTGRDEELLLTLTGRVRLVTAPLVARLWGSSAAYVRRRLAQLRRGGLLMAARVQAHPLLDLGEPLIRWMPGEPDPDAGRASYRAKARWTRAPVETG